MDFIKVLFVKNKNSKRLLPKVEKLKVVVTEFVEYGNYNFANSLTRILQRNPNFDIYYFTEPFDKSFLSLQGRHFFDLSDTGNKILQKFNADVVIWDADPLMQIGAEAYMTVVDGKIVYRAEA